VALEKTQAHSLRKYFNITNPKTSRVENEINEPEQGVSIDIPIEEVEQPINQENEANNDIIDENFDNTNTNTNSREEEYVFPFNIDDPGNWNKTQQNI
jgi:hypothetical protein